MRTNVGTVELVVCRAAGLRAGFFRIRFTADPVELTFFRAGLDRWLQ